MQKILDVPTQPRSKREEKLLDEIMADPSLQSDSLRRKLQNHMNHDKYYVLVVWLHPSAPIIRYSFENENCAMATHNSHYNQKSTPRIIGIRNFQNLNY